MFTAESFGIDQTFTKSEPTTDGRTFHAKLTIIKLGPKQATLEYAAWFDSNPATVSTIRVNRVPLAALLNGERIWISGMGLCAGEWEMPLTPAQVDALVAEAAEYERQMIAEAAAETAARQAKRDEIERLEAREVELAAEWVEVDQRLTRAEETLVMYAKRGVGGQALEGRALEVRRLADELAGLTKLMTSCRERLAEAKTAPIECPRCHGTGYMGEGDEPEPCDALGCNYWAAQDATYALRAQQAEQIAATGGDPVAFGLSPAEAYLQRTLTPEYRQSAFERAVSTVVTANHDLQRSVNAMYAERMGR